MDDASSSCPSDDEDDDDDEDEDDEQDEEEEDDEDDTTPDCRGLARTKSSASSVRGFFDWIGCASLLLMDSFLFKSAPSVMRKQRRE